MAWVDPTCNDLEAVCHWRYRSCTCVRVKKCSLGSSFAKLRVRRIIIPYPAQTFFFPTFLYGLEENNPPNPKAAHTWENKRKGRRGLTFLWIASVYHRRLLAPIGMLRPPPPSESCSPPVVYYPSLTPTMMIPSLLFLPKPRSLYPEQT